MKLSVTSYSYAALVGAGQVKEIDLIALAKRQGFAGIEFAEIHPDPGEDKRAYANRLRQEAERVGMKIVAYAIGADLLSDTDREIGRLKAEAEVAAALGADLMRHDASGGYRADVRRNRGFNEALPTLIEGYNAVTDHARRLGVRTCIENHGFFAQDASRVLSVIGGVADENFGALVDVGNFLCADEDPGVSVGLLAPYAMHVHVKDFLFKSGSDFIPDGGFFMTRGGNFLRGTIVGHGVVPVQRCLRILKNAGYDGWYTVEFEGMEPCLDAVRLGKENLEKMLETL